MEPSPKVPINENCCTVPGAMVGLSGAMVTETSGNEVMVIVVLPVTPFKEADIVTVPVFLVRATPLLVMFARLAEELCQLTPVSRIVLPSLKVPMAVNWILVRVGTIGAAGSTVIEVSLAEDTLRVADPMTFWNTALIFVLPMLSAFAKPVLLTSATTAEEDSHWACEVTSCVLPSAKTAVAVYCCVPPIPIAVVAGVTET